MERWAGKVAIVTGASAGIGAATAEALVKEGLQVVAVARRVDRIDALQKALKGERGQIYPYEADLSKNENVTKLFEWVKSKFGKLHILINNAGILRAGGIEDAKLQDLVDVINVNFTSVVACTQAGLRLMRQSGVDDGHIIHINCYEGHHVPNVGSPLNVYPSSKHAITALTESMRQELNLKKSKIRVTSISPGFVQTEIVEATMKVTDTEIAEKFMADLGSVLTVALTPEDISSSILYVLSTPPHVQIHELVIKPVGEQM